MATTNGVATTFLYEVLTLAEAAAYLKLTEDEVRTEAEANRMKGVRLGDKWRFVREDVLRWVRTPRPAEQTGGASPGYQETEEEYQAYWASILAFRDEVDRLHERGKYAEGE